MNKDKKTNEELYRHGIISLRSNLNEIKMNMTMKRRAMISWDRWYKRQIHLK